MRARLLLIPFIFSVPVHAQDVPSQAGANPPVQVEQVPVRDLSQLPMDGGWTYGELLGKAAAGDFRANMLAGEYWMGLYYLNRGDLPLACLEHMQHFFREAAAKSGHPAPKLMMTDPYGIFGIFKAQSMQPEHAEWLDACRKLAESVIADGTAFEKCCRMFAAQGGDISVLKDADKFRKAKYSYELTAQADGYIYKNDVEKQVNYYYGINTDGFSGTGVYLRSGIGIMKYVHPDDTNRKEIKAKAEPAIRFAEILLIYAEALNELEDGSSYDIASWDGSTSYSVKRDIDEMKKGIRQIRRRAGVPDYTMSEYQDRDVFRKKLKRERQIELMAEGQRYFDLRRWKDAEVEESKKNYGCNFYMSDTEEQREQFYTPIEIADLPTAFSRKLYFWPISHDELKRNKRLTQNPGWTYND